jgi:TonB family protein
MLRPLSPRFRVPVMLSVGLHGIVVVAIGAFVWNADELAQSRHLTMVELVAGAPQTTPLPPKLARTAPPPVRHPRVHHPVVSRVAARALHQASQSRAPALVPPRFESDSARPTLAAEAPSYSPPPAEIPEPVAHSPAAREDVVDVDSSALGATQAAQTLLVLANMATMPPEHPRMLSETGRVRLLKDPVAEAGAAVRSRARAGDNPRPEYPRAAREAGWEGMVLLRVEVLPDGRAGFVTLHRTSGHAILDEAALSAVQRWRFIPAMDGNFPIRSVVHLPIRFDLRAIN